MRARTAGGEGGRQAGRDRWKTDRQAALHHGSQGQVMGALLPSSHTLAHSQKDPVLTDGCGLRVPFSPRGSIPGLVLGGPPRSSGRRQQQEQWGLGSWSSSGGRQLLTQVLSFCEEARGRKGREGEERRREGGGGGQQEGGRRENAEVLKGTLTSFLGFPWQPNIPQMNISVREREEAERGEGWREMEAEMERDGGDRRQGGGEMEAGR